MGWGLNLLLLPVLLPLTLWPHGAGGGSAELPHPWLTERADAKVLKLVCTPPPEAAEEWEEVYSLHLFAAFRSQWTPESRNESLANVTSTRTSPVKEKALPDIASVRFSGSWDNKTPSLTVLTPVSRGELGVYYCEGEFSRKGSTETPPTFSSRHAVDESFVYGGAPPPRTPSRVDTGFEVSVVNTHEVNVTWRPPQGSKFLEAGVSMTSTDQAGKAITAPRALFAETVSRSFVYISEVVLTEFRHPHRGHASNNYSLRLFVDSALCHPYCRYSCSVPYKGCFGRDARLCVCSQAGVGLITDSSSSSSSTTSGSDCSLWIGLFVAVTCLLVICIAVFCLRKRLLNAWLQIKSFCTRTKKDRKEPTKGGGKQHALYTPPQGDDRETDNEDRVPFLVVPMPPKTENGEQNRSKPTPRSTSDKDDHGEDSYAAKDDGKTSTRDLAVKRNAAKRTATQRRVTIDQASIKPHSQQQCDAAVPSLEELGAVGGCYDDDDDTFSSAVKDSSGGKHGRDEQEPTAKTLGQNVQPQITNQTQTESESYDDHGISGVENGHGARAHIVHGSRTVPGENTDMYRSRVRAKSSEGNPLTHDVFSAGDNDDNPL